MRSGRSRSRRRLHNLETLGADQRSDENPRVSPQFTPKRASQQFGNLFNAYAKAINRAYGRTGSLFQHPFGRVPVTSDAYLVQLVAYIHRNPQRHGFVDDFRDWPYLVVSRHALRRKPRAWSAMTVLALVRWRCGIPGYPPPGGG